MFTERLGHFCGGLWCCRNVRCLGMLNCALESHDVRFWLGRVINNCLRPSHKTLEATKNDGVEGSTASATVVV
jgi:hypothetical protein